MRNRCRESSTLSIIIKVTLLFVLLPMLSISCEQFFTHSVMSWAQRDPSNLPEAQRIAYAQSVLGSGDQKAMADAYDAIKDNTDPDVQLLASKLAVGASGINEAVAQALDDMQSGSTSSVGTYIDSMVDPQMLTNAVNSMASATNDASTASAVTPEEYLTTAAACLILALPASPTETDINNTGDAVQADIDNSLESKTGSNTEKAAYYLLESGYSSEDLKSMLNYS
mgnify:CR=1 FL=1